MTWSGTANKMLKEQNNGSQPQNRPWTLQTIETQRSWTLKAYILYECLTFLRSVGGQWGTLWRFALNTRYPEDYGVGPVDPSQSYTVTIVVMFANLLLFPKRVGNPPQPSLAATHPQLIRSRGIWTRSGTPCPQCNYNGTG